jgi:tRNA 2-thiouridine synthesizing protein E
MRRDDAPDSPPPPSGIPALDADGFLADPAAWDEATAHVLARLAGIPELTGDHWRVIRFLRAYWREHGVVPMVRVLCRETGCSLDRIYELFPDGPSRGACRVAGLPKPDSCV